MKTCKNCGVENHDNAKFCIECGIQFPETKFVCKNCGHIYEKMMKYCPECGSMMQTNANLPTSDFANEFLLTKELDLSHKAIDLGLSVKWADRNIGAPSPMEKGDYFAWGELKPKYYYGQDSYQWYRNGRYLRPGGLKSIVGSEFDIAQATWGDKWRIPTTRQFEELVNKCTWEKINPTCFKVTGINGNSIILPVTGIFEGSDILFDEEDDYVSMYWAAQLVDKKEYEEHFCSNSLINYDEDFAWALLLESPFEDSFDSVIDACERYKGLNVRAVL